MKAKKSYGFGIIHETRDIERRIRDELALARHAIHTAQAVLLGNPVLDVESQELLEKLLNQAMERLKVVSGD